MRAIVKLLLVSTIALLAVAGLVMAAAAFSPQASILVNSTSDELIPGNGECTLREAINNANTDSDTTSGDCIAGSGADMIVLPAGTYLIAIPGKDEDLNATGDLDILDVDGLIIQGAGADTTIIEASGVDRVLHMQNINPITLTLNNLTVSGGYVPGDGGGIYNYFGILVLHQSTVKNNISYNGSGGGISIYNGSLLMDQSIVENNLSRYGNGGGGIYRHGFVPPNNTVTIIESTLRDNHATGVGGFTGIGGGAFLILAELTIDRTAVISNTALQGSPGGLMLLDSPGVVVNSTISGNTSDGAGGGIIVGLQFSDQPFTLAMVNNTIAGNSTDSVGGGLLVGTIGSYTPTVSLANTIIAGNFAPVDPNCTDDAVGAGILDSLGYNLEDDDTCNFDQPTDQVNTDPLLEPLDDNGGLTWTHALQENSPAVDAASNAVCAGHLVNGIDQRGVVRPQGDDCDIGAFELDLEPIVNLTAWNDSPTILGATTTLSATVESGTMISYTWDLGDGSIKVGQVITHTYTATGIYTATVTATNDLGFLTATTNVTILPQGWRIFLPGVLRR